MDIRSRFRSRALFFHALDQKKTAPEFGNGAVVDLVTIGKITYSPQSEFKTNAVNGPELFFFVISGQARAFPGFDSPSVRR
jgi:hypothetical protein